MKIFPYSCPPFRRLCLGYATLTLCALLMLLSDSDRARKQTLNTDFTDSLQVNDANSNPTQKLAVSFLPNIGQIADNEVKYAASIFTGMVYVKDNSVVFALTGGATEAPKKLATFAESMQARDRATSSHKVAVFAMEYEHEQRSTLGQPKGIRPSTVQVSRFAGNETKNWISNLISYQSVGLGELWPGITVTLAAYAANVEQLYQVSPGAHPQDILLKFTGINRLEIDSQGELVIVHDAGTFSLTSPIAYQEKGGERTTVDVAYLLHDAERVGFQIGEYDPSLPIIIDPLLASTYLGGTDEEKYAYDGFGGHVLTGQPSMIRDSSGNVYIVGQTQSANFPTTPGVYDTSYNDGASRLENDITVSKLSPGLNTLLASTLLGGSSEDVGTAIGLDADGNVYLTGFTRSYDFPTINGNHDISYNGGVSDTFVAKLSPNLTVLSASTFLGGRNTDAAYSLLIDGTDVIIAGDTASTNLPARTGAAQLSIAGETDAFLARLSGDLVNLKALTYLGGSGSDYGRTMLKENSGTLIVSGSTTSSNFPTSTGAYDQTHNGRLDVFVTRINRDLTTVLNSTFVGHAYDDLAFAATIAPDESILITGMTESLLFPTTPAAYSRNHHGAYDAYVMRLSNNLQTLVQSTLMGGSNWDDSYTIAANSLGEVFIAGLTRSSDYPITAEAYKASLDGTSDGFIAKFSQNLAILGASTYIGGNGNLDAIVGIRLDGAEDVLAVGVTNSSNFPTTPSAFSRIASGLRDMTALVITKNLLADLSSNHLEVSRSTGEKTLAMIAGSSSSIRVTAHDQLGNIMPSYNGDYSVVFSGAQLAPNGTAPTCQNKLGTNITFGNSTTLTFSSGVAYCLLKLYKTESISIDATIGSGLRSHDDPSWDLDVSVTPGALSAQGSILSAIPPTATVGQVETLQIVASDFYSNSLGAGGTGHNIQFLIVGANSATFSGTDNNDSTYTALLTPGHSGYDTITATINSTSVGKDTDGVSDGTYHLTTNSLGLDHLEIRYENPVGVFNSSATLQAGNSHTIHIYARDVLGNAVMTYDTYQTLYLSGLNPSPYNSAATCTDRFSADRPLGLATEMNFTDGHATCTLKPKRNETVSLDATVAAGANTYASPTYDLETTVLPGSVSHLTVTGPANWIAGIPQQISVKARDANGNVHPAYVGDRLLTLSGAPASYDGTMPTARDKDSVNRDFGLQTMVTFVQGEATVALTLPAKGVYSIDVSDGTSNSTGSVTWDLDVIVGSSGVAAPNESTIETSANPVGTCGQLAVTVRVRDSLGNQLESSAATVIVTISGANAASLPTTNRGDGSFQVLYPPGNSGLDSITATIDGAPVSKDLDGTSDGTFNETVNPEAANSATWTGVFSQWWHDPQNWNGSVVPTSCYDVVIDGLYTNAPTLDHSVSGRVTVRSLTLGATRASTFTVSSEGVTNYLYVRTNMTVGPFGTLTQVANATTGVHQIQLHVDGTVTLGLGATISGAAKGLTTTTNRTSAGIAGGLGDNYRGTGGSHGGVGSTCVTNLSPNYNVYGSYSQPTSFGSSGYRSSCAAGAGGSVVRITAQTVINNGTITVSGGDGTRDSYNGYDCGGGAGGSIWISASAISGSGALIANGGSGSMQAGSGGGGRIALDFDTNTYSGTATAYGQMGWNSLYGGAGTVYFKDNAESYGLLIVDNNSHLGEITPGVVGEAVNLKELRIRNNGYYKVVPTETLTLQQSALTGVGGYLMIDSGASVVAPNLTTISNMTVYNYSTLSLPVFNTMSALNFENYAVYNHSSNLLRVSGGSTWLESGTLPAIGNSQPITVLIIENGTMIFNNQVAGLSTSFDSITINNGGVLSHSGNGTNPTKLLNLTVNALAVNIGGTVDLNAKGYAISSGAGAAGPSGGVPASYTSAGAGYGGVGGITSNSSGPSGNPILYGSVSQPFSFGSAGYKYGSCTSGEGGGILKVTAASVVVDGTVTSTGGTSTADTWNGYYCSAGSGGSIWIATSNFSGSGTIRANGGLSAYAGGGGGGRIAVHSDNNSFSGAFESFGGQGSGSNYGGAGTVFLRDNAEQTGILIINNNGHISGQTRGLAGETLNLKEIRILNGGYYTVVGTQTVTIAQALLDGTNGRLRIEGDGTFSAPNLSTILGLTIYNYSTLTLPSFNTMTGIRFENYGIYNHSSTTLQVNGASTWVESGTAPSIGNSPQTRNIIIANATVEFRNQTPTNAGVFDTITVNGGGIITHPAGGSAPTQSLNLSLTALAVNTGGKIDISALGYDPGATHTSRGPAGGVGQYQGTGGGHGGMGGPTSAGHTASTSLYGSVSEPITFGSSGYNSGNGAGAGGGVLHIAAQNVHIDGSIESIGGIGTTDSWNGYYSGGGAGGSIWINTNNFSGNGAIKANGGQGSTNGGGGGGGGRIAIYYTSNSFSGSLQTYGGLGWSSKYGGSGTVYTKLSTDERGSVTIDNNSHTTGLTRVPSSPAWTVQTTFIKNGATLTLWPSAAIDSRLIDVGSTGTLLLDSFTTTTKALVADIHVANTGVLRHTDNSTTQNHIVNLLANNITIDAGGLIDLDALGYDPGYGPGKSTGTSGAGYGGYGATGTTGVAGVNYGSRLLPIDIGSGSNAGATGGGALRIQTTGTLTLNGQIRARGSAGGTNQGGGSGGSILLIAQNIAGNGFISANGGNGLGNGGGGAGGRIAVYYIGQTFLTDGGHITLAAPGGYDDPVGGTGYGTGADGTLYMSFPDHYQITGSATQAAGTSQTITISLIDNLGNPFIWDGTRNLLLSGSEPANGTPPSCTDRLGNVIPFNSPTTLDFVNGTATCIMTLYQVAASEIDLTDGTYRTTDSAAFPANTDTFDLNVNVTGSPVASILNSRLSADKELATLGELVTATVTLYDDFGNRVTSGSNTVSISVTGANTSSVIVTNHGDGTYTGSYTAAIAGLDSIRATANGGPVMDDTEGVPDGIFHVSVVDQPANHLEVRGANTQLAGSAQTIAIRAASPAGFPDGNYAGVHSITLSGATVSPYGNAPSCMDRNGVERAFGQPTELVFENGEATCQMHLYTVESVSIDATDQTLSSSGNMVWDLDVNVSLNVNGGVQGVISALPSPAVDGDTVSVTISTTDAWGNTWARSDLNATLWVLGANPGSLSASNNGNGTHSASYLAVNVGIDNIRGTIGGTLILHDTDGTSDGVYQLPIMQAVVPHHLTVTGNSTQLAGTAQTITIIARGLTAATALSYRGTKSITLSGGLTATKGQVPTCLDRNGVAIPFGSAMSLEFTNGTAQCSMVLYRAGDQSINASDGTLTSLGDPTWALDVTVSASLIDNASALLSGSGTSVNTKDTVIANVYARDAYGNNVSTGSNTVTLSVSGANVASLTVSDNGNGSYSGDYLAHYPGLDEIRGTFGGVPITQDTEGTSDGVYHLTVQDTIVATHLEVKGAAVQVAGEFQTITIQALDDEGYLDYSFAGIKPVKLSGANKTATNKEPACIDRRGAVKSFGTITNLNFTSGQATCQMVLYKVESVHIDAESDLLNSFGDETFDLDTAVQSAGTGVASAVIDVKPNPIMINGTATVTVTTLDEYGNITYDPGTILTGSVTGANVRILVLSDQTDGTYIATYTVTTGGVDNISGTLNSEAITADTDGLSNGTYVLRVMSVGFADHLELSGANTQDVGSAQIITVSAKMLGGSIDTSYSGVHSVYFSGAHAAPSAISPTCRDRNGVDRTLGLATELNFVAGVATSRMYLYKAELAEIDATDSVISTVGDPAWDLDVTVGINPGGIAQGRISATVTTAIENEVVDLTVQAVDAYGNDWAKAGLVVSLNITGANAASPAITDNGNGTYKASYTASYVGDDVVRGTIGGSSILYDAEGLSDGVYHITVLAGILPHHFEVTGTSSQVAGSAQVITITARAETGEVAPSYRGDKNIALSGGMTSLDGHVATCTDRNATASALGSGTVLTFNNGVAQCSLKLYRIGAQSIDATDGLLSSSGDPLWDLDIIVSAGATDTASSLLVGSATSVNTKDTVSAIVYARDAYWNSITTGGASVTLRVTGTNGGILAATDMGDGTYTASYLARYPGSDAIHGTFNSVDITHDNEGVNDGVYHLVVNDTILAKHLEVTGSATQFSGTFQTITISAKDDDGYRAFSYQGVKTLKLSGANKSPAGFKPACLDLSGAIKPFGAAVVLQFVNGQASCLMVLYQLELAHVDATETGSNLSSTSNETWDLDVLVQANSGDNQGGVISATPNPAQMGSSIAITVSISDSFGNSLTASGLDVGLTVSGANPQNLTVLDNHDGTYSAQYVAEHHGVDFIEGSINGEPITADTDGNSDGTYQLTILPLNSVLSATPSPTEKGKEVSVEITVTGTQPGVMVTGLGVNISVNGSNTENYIASDVGGGKYRAKYTAVNEGVDFITGTVDSALIKADTDGVSDGIFQLPVVGSRGGVSGRYIAGIARYESSAGRAAIGVEVTDGDRTATSNQFGYYVIYDVPNGNYTLSGAKTGYSVYAEPGVNPITIDDAPVVNANLIVSASVPVEVVAPWNSYLGNVVIAEIFNSGTEPLTAELTLYRQEGSKADSDPERMLVRIPVEQQRDIILNAMKGFKLDSYGVLRIRFSHPHYSGQVSYYKVIPGEIGFRENADLLKKEFDYALANPFVGSTYGKSYVMFNTHQPSGKAADLEKLVPNWLTVVNGSASGSQWFTIRKYDESGKLLLPTSAVGMVNCVIKSGDIRCKVAPFGRIDIDGGHVFPGPNHTGLIEVIPDSPQTPYSANIVRYGMGAAPTVYTEKYDFASYFQARPGSFKEQIMPISTTSGAENWLEIANVSTDKQTVTVEYFYYDGEFAGAQNFKLNPKGQVHVNVEPIIGKGRSGVVKLSGQGSNGVIAHNLSYYRLNDRSVYVVTGTQSAEPNRARIAGTYNRFLNMSNWLRITNLTSSERMVALRLHVNQKTEVYNYKLPAYGGADVPLHDPKYGIAKNMLGMFEIQNDDPAAVFAQMYRMKHADTVPFDFVMPTDVR